MSATSPSGDAAQSGSQYDLLLAAIPLLLGAGVGLGFASDLPLRTGVTVGSLLATLPVGYALFGAPPRGGPGRGAAGN